VNYFCKEKNSLFQQIIYTISFLFSLLYIMRSIGAAKSTRMLFLSMQKSLKKFISISLLRYNTNNQNKAFFEFRR